MTKVKGEKSKEQHLKLITDIGSQFPSKVNIFVEDQTLNHAINLQVYIDYVASFGTCTCVHAKINTQITHYQSDENQLF